jgi:DNA-binding SARP family transcriptional activator
VELPGASNQVTRRHDPGRAGLWLGILGSLQAGRDGQPIALGPRKQQLVLAVLLCNANCLVPVDVLIEALWSDCPPRNARKNLQVYVCALRGLLGESRSRQRITHQMGGYLLQVAADELDWLMFEQQVRSSRQLWRHEHAPLARDLGRALTLWRGPVLEGMRGNTVIDAAVQRFESRLVSAFEDWAEVEVASGGALGAIDEIANLAQQHPFRERLRMVQMTALGQIGRRAEALGVYDELRRGLAREYGLSPTGALTAFYQALLREGSATPARPADQPLRRAAAFCLLPRDPANFVGRDGCTAELAAELASRERLAVLTGPTGAGKTTLAVHVAHRLRDGFPDGCFFVRLRTDGGSLRPLPQVVSQLWSAVLESGASGGPGDRDELWRRWQATHRVLIVLDDARTEQEVRPLLPEAGESAIIVTSRARLTGLGSACRITLPPLSMPDAMELLRRIIGSARVDRDPGSAERILAASGLSPLSVRVIGGRLAALGHVPLHEYLARVGCHAALLDELTAADITVRTRLREAVEDVPEPARRVIPLLGMLPAPLFTLAEAARALRLEDGVTMRVLELLLEMSILTTPADEVVAHAVVYEMPVLTYAYARELAAVARPANRSRQTQARPVLPPGNRHAKVGRVGLPARCHLHSS